MSQSSSVFKPPVVNKPGHVSQWGRLYGSSYGLTICNAATEANAPFIVVTPDNRTAFRLEYELQFYGAGTEDLPLLHFPDWETLPYDTFSPHQDIVSDRLLTLQQLPELQQGILVLPVSTVMQRIAPKEYLDANCFDIATGQQFDMEGMRRRLVKSGYRLVSQVMEHGEFAVRGSIIDLFPMGSRLPYRIELFDDEVETIRTFDADSQRTIEQVNELHLLPAKEFPLTDESIARFRQAHRAVFEGDPNKSNIYRDVSNGITVPGIEYYLSLFFESTATIFDYLPGNSTFCLINEVNSTSRNFWKEIEERYEQRRHDPQRPILPPNEVYLQPVELLEQFRRYPQIEIQSFKIETRKEGIFNFDTETPPAVNIDAKAGRPAEKLVNFIENFDGKILIAAESTGRRETLLELLRSNELSASSKENWHAFLKSPDKLSIAISPLENGLLLSDGSIAVISESQIYGEQVLQQRRRRAKQRDPDLVIKNLVELEEGSPVVHEDHGVGRYKGLQILKVGEIEQEFLTLEYAGGDKLYVPVVSLHLISRYTGASPEAAPLHKLGSTQWEKARRKARERARDVAAELLDIYARREARSGHQYQFDEDSYRVFAGSFPFEETPDQQDAIGQVLSDLKNKKPMDRLVCGDVGFGKTEVAMRAAFVAVQDGKQVAMLVPTTLLAQQHYENFKDRFSDLAVNIESLSRFRSKKDQDRIIKSLSEGTIDIVIGTHKLIQEGVKFKNLGLVIIDEEHRFGVRQKERFKSLRSEVDLLTLTATPIPRTLNMSLSGMRDLSIIASPPAKRLAIKTFVSQWSNAVIQEACTREIHRGGQVFFLHNEVETIEKTAEKIRDLLPEALVEVAHGQMRERELEKVMADFYHQRFNVLVCTTIIETGIDVPNANTIILNRADKFGLAQLYQLRGRVGRSHHQAYAYLIVPPRASMSADAVKRLEAIESMEDLGTGFTLATHDLEIRGAGELLGEEQSGQMQEIGFTMFMELLERAVNALKSGEQPELDKPLDHGSEIDLSASAIIPDDYLPDIHSRLIMYKRIANAASDDELREMQVEMIDRFGLLPESTKTLFRVTSFKLKATKLGIRKIEMGNDSGRIIFNPDPRIDPMTIINLIQQQSSTYKLEGSEKLRIIKSMPDLESRCETLQQLLEILGGE